MRIRQHKLDVHKHVEVYDWVQLANWVQDQTISQRLQQLRVVGEVADLAVNMLFC
jgi:hypothetical protein